MENIDFSFAGQIVQMCLCVEDKCVRKNQAHLKDEPRTFENHSHQIPPFFCKNFFSPGGKWIIID
jgi:hypothetical protein